MTKLFLFLLIATAWLRPPALINSPTDQQTSSQLKALLEEVHLQADRAGDPLKVVRIKAKAAGLLWLVEPELGRLRFTQLWTWVNAQPEGTFNRETARGEVLQQLFQRDAALANRWLRESAADPKAPEISLQDKLSGKAPEVRMLTNMANGLMEQDQALAGMLLQQSFDLGYSIPAHIALNRMTSLDPTAGYALGMRVLSGLKSQPATVALAAAQLFFNDYYPLPGSPIQAAGAMIDDSMRRQYYHLALEILRRSMQEPPPANLTAFDRKQRESHQALLALGLNAMTPKYNAAQTEEMRQIADRMAATLPPEFSSLPGAMETRVRGSSPPSGSPDQLLGAALARGDYATAASLVPQIPNESMRPIMNRMIAQARIRSLVAKGELAEALPIVLGFNDATHRVQLLGDLAQAASRKKEPQFAKYILSLVIEQSAEWPCSVNKASSLLPLTHIGNSWELLDQTVSCLNSLPAAENQFMSNVSFHKAFQLLAAVNWERTLEATGALKATGLELMARLAACEGLLRQTK